MTYLQDPEYQPLLNGVLADPADMAPRYAFADWLMEHPDPVANHRGRVVRNCLEGKSLYRKDAVVLLGGLDRHFRHWRVVSSLTDLARSDRFFPGGADYATFQLRHGFAFRADMPIRLWDSHGAAVFAAQPIVEVRTGHLPRLVRLKRSGAEAQVWHTRTDTTAGRVPAGLLAATWYQPEMDVRMSPGAGDFCGVLVPPADGSSERGWRRDEASDLAREALNRAVIGWGRERAGLDPAGRAA